MKSRLVFCCLYLIALVSVVILSPTLHSHRHHYRGVTATTAADMGLSPALGGGTFAIPTQNYWLQQLGYWAPMRYMRMGASWDAFGTWNGSSCVTPSSSPQASTFIQTLYDIEKAGYTPLIVFGPDIWGATAGYVWPGGAQVGPVPNDPSYACGMTKLIDAVKAWGLYRSDIRFEVYNEPDNGQNIGAPVSPEQAAHYVGDAIYGGGKNFILISGTFASPYNDPYTDRYIKYLQTYRWGNGVWSVHDYNDIIYGANHGCDSTYSQGCSVDGAQHFLWKLGQDGAETDKVWVTEIGDPSYQGWVQHSRAEEAHAAWNFEKLRWSGVKHVFWYQWHQDANDPWDSALVNYSDQNRPSFCVIAYNEVPSWSLNDGRCTASAKPAPGAHTHSPERLNIHLP